MNLVTVRDVGAVSLERMIRDRVVLRLAPGFGAPVDLPVTRDDRASTLSEAVPTHTVVSGLAGLWIHLGGERPASVDLVGVRGLHRPLPDFRPLGWRVRFHSGGAAEEAFDSLAGLRVAAPERCASDGLRWDDLGVAIPAVMGAIGAGQVDIACVSALVASEDPRGLGAARLKSAWAAIRASVG